MGDGPSGNLYLEFIFLRRGFAPVPYRTLCFLLQRQTLRRIRKYCVRSSLSKVTAP
jgi:hypothetical protein